MNPQPPFAAEGPAPNEGGAYVCTTTIWSLVLTAGEGGAEALERLCKIYWRPVYAFIQSRRHCGPDEARDLTQSFFAMILEKQGLKSADPEKGRFRHFLLQAANNFLRNEWHERRAVKRGGRCDFVSLEAAMADGGFGPEPSVAADADKVFDRKWALTVVGLARERLRKQYLEDGRGDIFETMEPFLTEVDARHLYAEWAAKLSKTEPAIQVAYHRLKRRFGQLLREEVAQTVRTPGDLKDELRHLIGVLSV